MPKVRASSATIGTTRGPSAASLSRPPIMRTKAMVVLISRPSGANAKRAQRSIGGISSGSHSVLRRGR